MILLDTGTMLLNVFSSKTSQKMIQKPDLAFTTCMTLKLFNK